MATRKLPKLTLEQREKLKLAKRYCMDESIRHSMKKEDKQQKAIIQNKTAEAIQKQQVSLLMTQCFIGGLDYNVGMREVREAFAPFGILKAVNLDIDPLTGRHKGYAYVEYDLPEGSQLAIEQMCGISLNNRPIRCGRPTNTDVYQELIDALIEKSKKSPIIYVSNLAPNVMDDDLRVIFSPFGDVVKAVLIRDFVTGKHKTYGFVEYTTIKAAADATESMNLFELKEKQIRVGRAMIPPPQVINPGPVLNFERTSTAMAITQGETADFAAIGAPGVAFPKLALELK